MKKILTAVLLMIIISAASFAREITVNGKTNLAYGDYTVKSADPVSINGVKYNSYKISYQNSPMEVTVLVGKDNNCKKYIVMSDKLAVQYVCNQHYFGVEKLDNEIRETLSAASDVSLNRDAYFHQKKITEGMNSEIENTRLIAVYFPMLLSEKQV
jgi:hypothetical protein